MLAAVTPLLAIVTCHDQPPPPERGDWLRFTTLSVTRPETWPAGLTLDGAWRLESAHPDFGSYSALVPLPDGRLAAYSDSGRILGLRDPSRGFAPVRLAVAAIEPDDPRLSSDSESATYDPATGTLWQGFEGWQGIRRHRSGQTIPESVKPAAMAHWPENGGPEAMVRMRDGRFIVMAERDGAVSVRPGEALLFPRDPLLGDEPIHFRFETKNGFQPTDMAQLPDGRVLILLRALRLGLPPFRSRLVIADPADIAAGKQWQWTWLADIDEPELAENYEGLAVTPGPNGGVTIWLISDDNESDFQRTLLLKLAWMPGAGTGRAVQQAP